MPRLNVDYTNTVIYKIVCNDLNVIDCYVGSTTDFTKRKNSHKNTCNNETACRHHLKVYKMIRDNGGWENWTILVIEKYPCLDIHEATLRERHWYETLNATMNTLNPNRSSEEYHKLYRDENKEAICEAKKQCYINKKEIYNAKQAQYYLDNTDKVKAKVKEYYEANKEQINEDRKEYRKEYYEEHKEAKKESECARSKKYYEENKDKINASEAKKEYKRQYYLANKEKLGAISVKASYDENKDKINERRRELARLKKLKNVEKLI